MTDRYNKNAGREKRFATTLRIPSGKLVSDDTYHYYASHNDKSPKLKKDQLSLYGIDLSQLEDGSLQATALIRSTVHKPVRLKESEIVILDENGQPIARITENFSSLEALQPNTAYPWQFVFPPESIMGDEVPWDSNVWSLAFETKPAHKLDMTDEEKASISEVSLAKLRKIVEQAPALDKDELSFMGLSIRQTKDDELITTLLVRNGTIQDLELKQVPLIIYDALGEAAARGTFKLSHLTIKANSSKPITLVFPKEALVKEKLDLSSWKIEHVE
ncbi:hypothetical protein JNUCC1_01053 [Lentibacillus sp. JNUCC-1]|uniref:SLAP domain-containing protein n=1 Tax=Lentibacillus sp. JNUCC-1 TaxID=2654513 RepID=UPI0012E79602|nr:SLAP domain-containing protein [Lentibacillus sp. JNUCC-1]MUV37247.1 hypothetical protein [Lentibacillus sp. JNUCC-1]